MTSRPNEYRLSPVEEATQALEVRIAVQLQEVIARHQVERQMPGAEFRKMIARYFHDKSQQDWYDMLGVQETADKHSSESGSTSGVATIILAVITITCAAVAALFGPIAALYAEAAFSVAVIGAALYLHRRAGANNSRRRSVYTERRHR